MNLATSIALAILGGIFAALAAFGGVRAAWRGLGRRRGVFAALAVFALDRRHLLIRRRLGTVQRGDVHFTVSLVVVFNVAERVVEIVVEILLCGRLIRVLGVFDHFLQPAFDGPESNCCNSTPPPSFTG